MNNDLKNFIKDRITELRMLRHISESKMSRELGHDSSYLQKITTGKAAPSIDALQEILDYFEMTPQEFFDNSEYGKVIRAACEKMNRMDSKDLLPILSIIDSIDDKEQKLNNK
ncbi:MAG: helix-turn-helix transcriptional regulator [Acutalibacteraceae bacterium]|nr:helix-turn-helix transcriptional regulator [Acutalibacteraceae bacterium]